MRPIARAFSTWFTSLLLTSLVVSLEAAAPTRRYVMQSYPNEVNTNVITATLKPMGEVPEFMAIVVQKGDDDFDDWDEDPEAAIKKAREEAKNRTKKPALGVRDDPFANATWVPFQSNVVINLGPGDGERLVLFSYRYKGQTRSDGSTGGGVTVRTVRPTISILNPSNAATSLPIIQLQGMASRSGMIIHYDRYSPNGKIAVSNEEAFCGSTFMGDKHPSSSSARYFTCFDVELDPGTNRFVFRFQDDAGNKGTTNFNIVFSTAGDHTPPHLLPEWPKSGVHISGNQFTARGKCDDPAAKLDGLVMTREGTNQISGFVERNGVYWYEHIPLGAGANRLVFTATDAAGNSSATNMVVYGSERLTIHMNPVAASKLWDRTVHMSGTVKPANCDVWINGVKATVNQDGTWMAENVPVKSPNGGTATFEAVAAPRGTTRTAANPSDYVSSQARLGTNAMVLNASSPACGVFQLHLSETAGKPFVLFASTNLTEWTPILTNLNPTASFDYTEEATNHVCRFFKVVPLR
jgi:hypothetical protein